MNLHTVDSLKVHRVAMITERKDMGTRKERELYIASFILIHKKRIKGPLFLTKGTPAASATRKCLIAAHFEKCQSRTFKQVSLGYACLHVK